MLTEEIEKAWAAHAKSARFYPTPTFVGDKLKLGAEIEIAAADRRQRPATRAQVHNARAIALFAAAYRQPLSISALGHLRRALVKQGLGESALAAVHLALMSLPRLDRNGSAAWRLFRADHLMQIGVAPETILAALDNAPSLTNELRRDYDPDQPRVPAGSGRSSGQWTSIGSGDEGQTATSTAATAERNPTNHNHEPVKNDDLGGNSKRAGVSARIWNDGQEGEVVSDANPEPVRPGQRYAAIAIAKVPHTGDPRIDTATGALIDILAAVDSGIPRGTGPLYGTALHVAFANAVRTANLPGIRPEDVEQSFDLDGIARYGLDGSIRTDIVLWDEQRENVIAIWDLKTGKAKLSGSRVRQLKGMVPGGSKAIVFELRADRD